MLNATQPVADQITGPSQSRIGRKSLAALSVRALVFCAITGVSRVRTEAVLEQMPARPATHFADLFDLDEEARRRTEEQVGGLAKV